MKMDLREIGWGGVDWIDLAQDRDQCRALVNTVMNLRIRSCTIGGLSKGLSCMKLLLYDISISHSFCMPSLSHSPLLDHPTHPMESLHVTVLCPETVTYHCIVFPCFRPVRDALGLTNATALASRDSLGNWGSSG
jgi:hypothetical protein